ncbi:MucBP domain-containing protein [Lacticaseibacillus hegangensis]|uniref:MucBP domain-containing protein n=2 Tax=Lacticaseibacillus hegangensis TaxID=2486010 RepID=A0ABW4D005_9LACO
MGLFQSLANWFKRRPRKTASKTPNPTSTSARPVRAAARQPQQANALPPATGATSRYVSVAIYYRERGSAAELRKPSIVRGPIGARLNIAIPQIEGYELFSVTNYLTRFPASQAVVYLLYDPHVAAPVAVYHRDETGRLLAAPTMLVGRLNAAFTAEPLPAFKDHAVPRGPQRGRFTHTAQVLHFTYQLGPSLTYADPQSAYVELRQAKPAYPTPVKAQVYATMLPAGSFWRVFGLAKNQAGEVFLDLGGSQWITTANTQPQNSNPFLPGPTQLKLTTERVSFNAQPLQAVGQVNTSGSLTRWAKPYGQRLKPLAAGATVALLATVYGTDDSRWYRLSDDSYVLASLVDLL